MKTMRRLLYRDIVASVLFVALAFLSLFYFFDFVDELENVGSRGRTVWHAALAALLELPEHLYDLAPIAVLIGTIFSLARMAQSSEFTILRTAGGFRLKNENSRTIGNFDSIDSALEGLYAMA